jgi:5-methylcytosine-specific restriction endonuclease McrA
MSAVHRDRRWPAIRLAAKRRDGFKCVRCGARGRLEVDHVTPARREPERAFDLSAVQTLCRNCHVEKTRREVGHEAAPARQAWRSLLRRPLKQQEH